MTTLAPRRLSEPYCPFVHYATAAEYRRHFVRKYCQWPLYTFDSIAVMFSPNDFNHAFFEGDFKDTFSWARAARIDWIGKALQDPIASLHPGHIKSVDCYDYNRRVCFVGGLYLVVIEFIASDQAVFKTAYPTSSHTASMVRRSPGW